MSPEWAQTTPQAQGNQAHKHSLPDTLAPLVCNVLCDIMYRLLIFLCRYHGHLKEAFFSIGLQGIRDSDISTVKEVIWKTFNEVAE